MPQVRNPFKLRAADAPVLETSLFLHLYSPFFLELLEQDDFGVPKLLVVRGSPGTGKSSLLRLFDAPTLAALHARRTQPSEQELVARLTELGIFSDHGPTSIGIYLHCDSSLRDITNLDFGGGNARLLNTLLDVRIILGFLRGLAGLSVTGIVPKAVDTIQFVPLPSQECPPPLFEMPQTVADLRAKCEQLEAEFATLLNSFPGDPIPPSIKPHSRVFSIPFLGHQIQSVDSLRRVLPIVMLDDVHTLDEQQRNQVRDEFLRRAAVPRWLATRKHVYELEDLISLEGARDKRDFRELDLDDFQQPTFKKFVTNVADRRLRLSDSLQHLTVHDFKDQLQGADHTLLATKAAQPLREMTEKLAVLGDTSGKENIETGDASLQTLVGLELRLILAERRARKGQRALFSELEVPEEPDAKIEEAAKLFLARRLRLPYYFSFDTFVSIATGNVEQFLFVTSTVAEKMIHRAELGRVPALTAREQDELLRKCAKHYFEQIEQKHEHGYAIRQFVENLGSFCHAVTFRPNAPIAPGVNGFGFSREELRTVLREDGKSPDIQLFREVIRSAVAGNILFVRLTKQGQTGSEKVVFYLNRLLCAKYDLPLNQGGWQALRMGTVVEMMRGPVRGWGKKWQVEPVFFEGR
jgi:hypothetical protein